MFPYHHQKPSSDFIDKMRSAINFAILTALSAWLLTTSLCANIPLPNTSTSSYLFPRRREGGGGGGQNAPELAKPEISPPFSEAVQDRDLRSEMVYHQWHYEEWNEYWIPQTCLEEAEYNKLSADDFDVRTVWYDDCAAPWVVCRHRVAREPWDSILSTLGQVPVGMRQYLANLIILPSSSGSSEMTNAAAYTRGAVMVFTPTYFKLGVLFHEFSHILDTIALSSYIVSQNLGKPGTPFSETNIWRSAYANDTHVPTAYAKMTFQEDFADIGRWTMSDMVHRPPQPVIPHAVPPPSHPYSNYPSGGGSSQQQQQQQKVKPAVLHVPVGQAAGGQIQLVGAGLRAYSPGWEGCKWQISCFRRFLGPVIFTQTGRCTGKVRSSGPVPVPGALSRLIVGAGVGKMPTVADLAAGEKVDELEGGVGKVGDILVPPSVEDELHVYRGPVPGKVGY